MLLVRTWEEYYITATFAPLLISEACQIITKLFIYQKIKKANALLEEMALKSNSHESHNLINNNPYKNVKCVTTIYVFFKGYIILQGGLVLLKIDDLLSWDWIQVLWATWIILAGGIGCSIISLALFLIRLYASLANNESWKDGKSHHFLQFKHLSIQNGSKRGAPQGEMVILLL